VCSKQDLWVRLAAAAAAALGSKQELCLRLAAAVAVRGVHSRDQELRPLLLLAAALGFGAGSSSSDQKRIQTIMMMI
jgi:hypothetical protein